MIRDSFESKIIRVDGFNGEEVTCEVFHNDKLQEQFLASNQSKSLLLSGNGIYKLILKSQTFQRSVSFRISLFKEDGAQWLPLSDSNLFLDCLPEEVISPRFLMVLCKSKTLHIIEESRVVSEESSLSVSDSEEAISEIKVVDEIASNTCNTQEFFESIDSDFLDQSSIKEDEVEEIVEINNSQRLKKIWEGDNSEEIEANEKSCDIFKELLMYKNVCEETTKKLVAISRIGELQQARITELEMLTSKYAEINKDQVKRSQAREESLLLLVNDKENELKLAQDEVFRLRSDKRNLEFENKRLKDNVDNLSIQLSMCDVTLKTQEIKFLKEKTIELEKLSSKSLNISLSDSILAEKEATIKELHTQIQRLKPGNSKKNSQESFDLGVDELDDAVKAHAKILNLNEPIIRDKEQMYIFRNRKLSLILHNGNLMCRIGANFKPFKEYMETFVLDNTIIRSQKKRHSTEGSLDSEYDAQNFCEIISKSKSASTKFNKTTLPKRQIKS